MVHQAYQMVGDNVGSSRKPKGRKAADDFTLSWHTAGKGEIECGDAVSGHHQKLIW
jgi:hypothetical protein